MAVPFLKEMRIGAYLLKQKLAGRKRYPLVLMLEPLFRCNLACFGCGKIDYPDAILNKRLSVQGVPRRGRRVRRADGGDPGRRAADPQGDRRDRQGHRGAQEVRVAVHQRAAAREEAASVRAVALSVLLGASRRPQGAPRQVGVPGGRVRSRGVGDQGRQGEGLHRQRQCHDLRRASARRHRGVPRLRPRSRRRRLDLARLCLRAGARPGALPQSAQDQGAVPRRLRARQGQAVDLRPLRAVPRFPRRQPDLSLHALGHADAQRLRLAEALLSAGRRLREDLQGADGDDRLGLPTAPAGTRSARTAWPIAATSRPRPTPRCSQPLQALRAWLRGPRTDGPMAPEIALEGQRPAQYVFSTQVQQKLSEIRADEANGEGRQGRGACFAAAVERPAAASR